MIFEKNQKCKPWQLDLFRTLAKNKAVDPMKADVVFCVLATPRCGSTLFCDTLNNTGLVGWIEEWFNIEYFYSWQMVTGIDFTLSKYVDWVIRHTIKDTGVFGVKWHIAQVEYMRKQFDFGLENIKFDKIFYLRRRDKIAQAVSMARALKSDQFRSYEESCTNELPEYHEISSALNVITDHEMCYHKHYKRLGGEEIWYEDYQIDRAIFDSVLSTLGKEAPSTYHANVKKQRNPETEALAINFADFLKGGPIL